MKVAGFAGVMAAGFFSVFLLCWHGYNGYTTDWVFGFLAVFWSLIMMLRLMTLTEPLDVTDSSDFLAQKILRAFRERQEERRRQVLETSFGGSFVLFLFAGILFAGWQVYCAAFPADRPTLESLSLAMAGFFGHIAGGVPDAQISFGAPRFFDWAQSFMLFLALCMMGFVLRSYAADRGLTRPALIILCTYAAAGYTAIVGLGGQGGLSVEQANLTGNGAGSLSYLLSTMPDGKTLTLFDILLLENGVVGLGLLTFLIFVPLGYIALSAQQGRSDPLVVLCGTLSGMVIILSAFLPFTPPLAGFLVLCAMGLFLAWGASETDQKNLFGLTNASI